MFVKKEFRGRGLSVNVLQALESWMQEEGFRSAILETSIYFEVAKKLYLSNGYSICKNYPPYAGLEESVCMMKTW